MSDYVFVYGTLRQHEPNASVLRGAERIAEQAYTCGVLWDTGHGYPAVTACTETKVYGELYRVDPDILQRIDQLEGYAGPDEANHYERIEQRVYTDEGSYTAYVYVYEEEPTPGERIDSGDWKEARLDDQESILYFAYGSCMDDERFIANEVAPLFHDVLGRGVLADYTLTFSCKASDGMGRADLEERAGATMEGKLYRIGPAALDYLYVREGVADDVYRPTFVDVAHNGTILPDVLTFTVIDKQQRDVPPPDWYRDEILRGANGTVSEAYYEQLLAKFQEMGLED